MQQFISKRVCKIIFRAIWILLWGLHFISLTNALHEITPCKEFEMELELTKSFLTKQFNGVVLLHFLPPKLYRNGCHMVGMIYDFHAGMQAIASQSQFRIHSREKKGLISGECLGIPVPCKQRQFTNPIAFIDIVSWLLQQLWMSASILT